MVAGHLTEKNGYYYAVLSYYDNNGRRRQKWIATHLTVKGNKRKAQEILIEHRKTFDPKKEGNPDNNILFSDYMKNWLRNIKPTVAETTYSGYATNVERKIAPYFSRKKIKLKNLTPADIQAFYNYELKRVKASTVIHYHANIHRALKSAVKTGLLPNNPADYVERPKAEPYMAKYYSAKELNQLFEASEGTPLELPILLAAFYGLRRSEVIGLKWEAIDFNNNTIIIRHTVTSSFVDGKQKLIHSDTTKTKSSLRTLPLVAFVKVRLLEAKAKQERNKKLCGKRYNKKYRDYVCVDDLGELISPEYVTAAFPALLETNGLRRIRFHDLRHSCASLLLANGIPMKFIQEWLGHSDFATTANIYSHLDYSAKLLSAEALVTGLGLSSETTKENV